MYKKFVGALYVMNIIAQSIFTLLTPVLLMLLLSWLLCEKCGVGGWIYALLVTVGALAGLISMIKFAISASEGLERLEKQTGDKKNPKSIGDKNEKN